MVFSWCLWQLGYVIPAIKAMKNKFQSIFWMYVLFLSMTGIHHANPMQCCVCGCMSLGFRKPIQHNQCSISWGHSLFLSVVPSCCSSLSLRPRETPNALFPRQPGQWAIFETSLSLLSLPLSCVLCFHTLYSGISCCLQFNWPLGVMCNTSPGMYSFTPAMSVYAIPDAAKIIISNNTKKMK